MIFKLESSGVLAKNRWLAAALLAGLLGLFLVTLSDLTTEVPEPRSLKRSREPFPVPLSFENLDSLFSTNTFACLKPVQPTNSPFYTTFFQPPPPAPAQPKPAPPPPPTTRKITLIYLGFYEVNPGDRQAYLKIDDKLFVGGAGTNVTAGLAIAQIQLKQLVLTNKSGTNTLPFNAKTELEVPLQ